MKVFYLRDKSGFPVACVASELDDNRVRVALSCWNPRDEFDKQRGRAVAEGRLRAGKHAYEVPMPSQSVKMKVVKLIAATGPSQTVRDAAKNWLAGRSIY